MKSGDPLSVNSQVPFLPSGLDWPSVVGNLVLNFGILDSLVFQFLRNHLPDEDFAKVRNGHFKARVERIREYLNAEASWSEKEREAFDRFVADLDPVRELRNHIAHGHFLFRVDPDTAEIVLSVFQAKDLDRELGPGARHVGFDELLAGSAKLVELIEAMRCLVAESEARWGGGCAFEYE